MLRFIGNVIWLLLAGLPLAFAYAGFGLLAFILIITIPSGIASFRLAGYALWPFGRTVVGRADAGLSASSAVVSNRDGSPGRAGHLGCRRSLNKLLLSEGAGMSLMAAGALKASGDGSRH